MYRTDFKICLQAYQTNHLSIAVNPNDFAQDCCQFWDMFEIMGIINKLFFLSFSQLKVSFKFKKNVLFTDPNLTHSTMSPGARFQWVLALTSVFYERMTTVIPLLVQNWPWLLLERQPHWCWQQDSLSPLIRHLHLTPPLYLWPQPLTP